jgi:hypothetical protein
MANTDTPSKRHKPNSDDVVMDTGDGSVLDDDSNDDFVSMLWHSRFFSTNLSL